MANADQRSWWLRPGAFLALLLAFLALLGAAPFAPSRLLEVFQIFAAAAAAGALGVAVNVLEARRAAHEPIVQHRLRAWLLGILLTALGAQVFPIWGTGPGLVHGHSLETSAILATVAALAALDVAADLVRARRAAGKPIVRFTLLVVLPGLVLMAVLILGWAPIWHVHGDIVGELHGHPLWVPCGHEH